MLSELLVARRKKVTLYQVMIPAFHKFGERDHIEFVETDSAKHIGRVNAEMSRALVQASLLIGDSPILHAILRVRQLDIEFSDKAVGPAWDKKLAFEGVSQEVRHISELSGALTDLELAAGPMLRTPLILPEAWPVRARRWVSKQGHGYFGGTQGGEVLLRQSPPQPSRPWRLKSMESQ